jgi:hypothetical protein
VYTVDPPLPPEPPALTAPPPVPLPPVPPALVTPPTPPLAPVVEATLLEPLPDAPPEPVAPVEPPPAPDEVPVPLAGVGWKPVFGVLSPHAPAPAATVKMSRAFDFIGGSASLLEVGSP